MEQPDREKISEQVAKLLSGERTREEISNWAYSFIAHDDEIDVQDVEAWHDLVSLSLAAEMTAPGKYLYALEEIKEWMKEI